MPQPRARLAAHGLTPTLAQRQAGRQGRRSQLGWPIGHHTAAGGSGTWTRGVDFGAVLARSPYRPEVTARYRAAGLSLRADLATLTRDADIRADPGAVRSLRRTSVPTGRLAVPELDLHTISDQLVPVQQENYYAQRVTAAGPTRVTSIRWPAVSAWARPGSPATAPGR
jgi:hypothetical protein